MSSVVGFVSRAYALAVELPACWKCGHTVRRGELYCARHLPRPKRGRPQ